jgi:hypothetical protein
MKPPIPVVSLFALLLAGALRAAPVAAAEAPGLIPELPPVPESAGTADSSPYGLGKAKLAPPPERACISETALNDALAGSRCQCTCEEYAAGPAETCEIACGISYYVCWAPDPSDEEVRASARAAFADTLESLPPEARPAMEAEIGTLTTSDDWLAGARSALMLSRAADWEASRRCPPP